MGGLFRANYKLSSFCMTTRFNNDRQKLAHIYARKTSKRLSPGSRSSSERHGWCTLSLKNSNTQEMTKHLKLPRNPHHTNPQIMLRLGTSPSVFFPCFSPHKTIPRFVVKTNQVFQRHLPGVEFTNTLPPFCEPEGPPVPETCLVASTDLSAPKLLAATEATMTTPVTKSLVTGHCEEGMLACEASALLPPPSQELVQQQQWNILACSKAK